ncbi:general secretion pathway protein E [Thermotomaculum hydrothermale]|uniref:protein-secreting ATPase n=1 Tax=Thermotomaculum hydrothermale TaxID=981385 RepID=A0A7R6PRF8_9BACT|nr:type II secretion system ATPase GspE [Thermotomaculum hydrothermale]BBB32981.1 general secretion pathway protein E [Thermotomaculum hydrothermale]
MKKLGEILIDKGKVEKTDIDRALILQKDNGQKIGKILLSLGYITEKDLVDALVEQTGIKSYFGESFPDVEQIEKIEELSYEYLKNKLIFPLKKTESTLEVIMDDPFDFETIASLETLLNVDVVPYLGVESEILDALKKVYAEEQAIDETGVLGEIDEDNIEQLKDLASEAPVIRLVNQMISKAVEMKASDIHVEPFEKILRIRFRIDGVLHDVDNPPRSIAPAVISRIKIMSKLDIAEKRVPQDGRINLRVLGKEIDLRVSTVPTLHGESVVMRILDKGSIKLFDLGKLGFPPDTYKKFETLIKKPHGIILVTGPTGSGKTTTLYAVLNRLNSPEKKIITVEDPVEYQLEGVNQIHVNPQVGLTFASGLRTILRQDPDIILVGEIRDKETAEIAIQASLTGHLVLSTLHTNDACGAVTRLLDMGVEDYLISSTLIGVLAQRLVRVVCKNCRKKIKLTKEHLLDFGIDPSKYGELPEVYTAEGCKECNFTGYVGRMAIFELFMIDENVRKMILEKPDTPKLKAYARKNGMRTLREDGFLKVIQGITTPEEVLRVTQEE